MNKIINSPEEMIDEMIEGYLSVNSDVVERVPHTRGIILRKKKDKVGIVIGGGAGNEPWIIGYVGEGLADGAALGNVYTAPPARSILNVTKAINHSKGIIYVATNHMGDVLNFELVKELASLEGIKSECIFVSDDVSTAPIDEKADRRGVAGIALMIKILGAACEAGLSLEEVVQMANKVNDNLYTLGVTTSTGYMPSNGKAMCDLEEGRIEYGMGFNGEPGILSTPLTTAKEIVETMISQIIERSRIYEGDEVVVWLNGYGFTSWLELFIANKNIQEELKIKNIKIYDTYVGQLFCPQGTGGFSISLLKVDDELKGYYNRPNYGPSFFKRGREE